jgi:predicted HAD superfamily hydrolase
MEAKPQNVGPQAAEVARIISCDVFDTLLHRDHRSEVRRFQDIASLASARLVVARQILREPAVIFRVRSEVQREAYRALSLRRPSGDVRFADMVDAMARMLALDDDDAGILHHAEIAVELRQLTPNRPLLGWLTEQAGFGRRVIAISDTYHPAGTIAALLDALAPGHPIAAIYTSADFDATKRSGALFPAVLRAENARAFDVLHLGDDPTADVAMARAAGLWTRHLTRPAHLRVRRKVDALVARLIGALQYPGTLDGAAGRSPS